MPKVPVFSDVTAIGECTFEEKEYWKLKEFDGGRIKWWYDKRDFAILPDATDSEINEHQHEAIIYAR